MFCIKDYQSDLNFPFIAQILQVQGEKNESKIKYCEHIKDYKTLLNGSEEKKIHTFSHYDLKGLLDFEQKFYLCYDGKSSHMIWGT